MSHKVLLYVFQSIRVVNISLMCRLISKIVCKNHHGRSSETSAIPPNLFKYYVDSQQMEICV